jgi:hypothetical protein
LAAIHRNGVEAILITEMPRLYRRMEELLEVIRLAEQTELKQIIALDEAGYDCQPVRVSITRSLR